MSNITITFPSEELKQIFAKWLCNGGEMGYFDYLEERGYEDAHINYHGVENETYPINDPLRYGPFMVDDTIRVTAKKIDEDIAEPSDRP